MLSCIMKLNSFTYLDIKKDKKHKKINFLFRRCLIKIKLTLTSHLTLSSTNLAIPQIKFCGNSFDFWRYFLQPSISSIEALSILTNAFQFYRNIKNQNNVRKYYQYLNKDNECLTLELNLEQQYSFKQNVILFLSQEYMLNFLNLKLDNIFIQE